LKGLAGSNIWSGQNVQQFNTLAIAWSIAGDTFSIGTKYEWVRQFPQRESVCYSNETSKISKVQ